MNGVYLHKNKETKRLNELLNAIEKEEGITRRCIVHFLGDMNSSKFTIHTGMHMVCMNHFLTIPRGKHERETILLALLLHAYLREARQEPTSQLCKDLETHMQNLPFRERNPYDTSMKPRHHWLDLKAMEEHRQRPYWAVSAAVAWVSFDRAKFVRTSKYPKLPPPPTLGQLESFWLRLAGGNMKVFAKKLWEETHRITKAPVPEDIKPKMFMKHTFTAFDPYYPDWNWDIGGLGHLVKSDFMTYGSNPWEKLGVLVYAMEEESSHQRLSLTKYEVSVFEDVTTLSDTINDWGVTYHIHHPFAWKRMDEELLITSPYGSVVEELHRHIGKEGTRDPRPDFRLRLPFEKPNMPGYKDPSKEALEEAHRQTLKADLLKKKTEADAVAAARSSSSNSYNVPPPALTPGKSGVSGLPTLGGTSKFASTGSSTSGLGAIKFDSMTKAQLLAFYEAEQKKMAAMQAEIQTLRAGNSSSSSSMFSHQAKIIAVGDEQRLVAPKRGTSWDSMNTIAVLENFKLNIEPMKQTQNLPYRLDHMDQAWVDRFDLTFTHSEVNTVNWRDLELEKFFYEANRIYGSLKVSKSAFYTSDALYSQQYEELLKSTFEKKKHLWTGNYEIDRASIELLISNYSLLHINYPPQPHESESDKLEKQVTDFRAKWHSGAVQAYRESDKKSCRFPELNFIIQVDASTKARVKDLKDLDTFACRNVCDLLTSDHTANNYPTRFQIERGIFLKDYL